MSGKRKGNKPTKRTDKAALKMLKMRVGSAAATSQPPTPYPTWVDYFRTNSEPPKPYKSWLEYRIFNESTLSHLPYEPTTIPYTVRRDVVRRYTPDSQTEEGGVLVEVKGRFRTRAESEKYLDVALSHPDKRLHFIFARPGVKMPGAKKRKDGTYFTMEEWAEKNGFTYQFESELYGDPEGEKSSPRTDH